MSAPLVFKWSGEVMMPLPNHRRRCIEQFTVGEFYKMEPIAERSQRSHNHYFASIADKWITLPEHIAMQFPTPLALRKHALIMTGFCKERKFACGTPDEAKRLCGFLRQGAYDDYTLIGLNGCVVVEKTALSQSTKAMGAKTFQESKQAVLDWIDGLLDLHRKAA